MAYNNYPSGYQPYYPQYQYNQQQPIPQQPPTNNIIWVSGLAGAKSYLVAPNTTVQLWDSEANVIYLKTADATGMPSMKILDYTIRENTPQTHENAVRDVFATKEDISTLQAEIAQIRKEIKHGKSSVPTNDKSK